MPKLSVAEKKELDDLAFRVVADLPMGQAECDRYIALKEKRDGPEPRCSQDRFRWVWVAGGLFVAIGFGRVARMTIESEALATILYLAVAVATGVIVGRRF